MHARTTACAALAASGLLALPGVAGAAGGKTVFAGPLKVKGYQMTLMATDGGASDELTFMFNKTSGKSFQMHNYAFQKGAASVTVKGSKATIKGTLGKYGSVSLKLKAAKKTRGVVPKGCKGKPGTSLTGVVAGKLRLVPDTTFFKTVSAKSLKATIPGTSTIKCDGNGGGGTGGKPSHGVMLSSFGQAPAGSVMLSVSKGSAGTYHMVSVTEPGSDTTMVTHMITALGGASDLAASDDMTSATLTASGAFLSGSAKFTSEDVPGMSMGTLLGDYAAKFDSIGRIALENSDGSAMLQKY
jgi:hypothetical protein